MFSRFALAIKVCVLIKTDILVCGFFFEVTAITFLANFSMALLKKASDHELVLKVCSTKSDEPAKDLHHLILST